MICLIHKMLNTIFRRSCDRKQNKLHQEDEGNCLNQSSDHFSVNCMHPLKSGAKLMKKRIILVNSKKLGMGWGLFVWFFSLPHSLVDICISKTESGNKQ